MTKTDKVEVNKLRFISQGIHTEREGEKIYFSKTFIYISFAFILSQ